MDGAWQPRRLVRVRACVRARVCACARVSVCLCVHVRVFGRILAARRRAAAFSGSQPPRAGTVGPGGAV